MSHNNRKEKTLSSKQQFEILLTICLISGIVIISGFIIYHILTPEPGYITIGILNENQEAENYPTEASINETVSFYLTVENYLEKSFEFNFQIKKGTNETIRSSAGSNGTLQYMINDTLNHNEAWMSEKLNISFSQIGENQVIIAELWQITDSGIEYFDMLWLILNITV
ncbi:MAG: DUF1616 domain-containing protein [Promethearchaeota archaeon]|jgi:uncharacterized membrane protein